MIVYVDSFDYKTIDDFNTVYERLVEASTPLNTHDLIRISSESGYKFLYCNGVWTSFKRFFPTGYKYVNIHFDFRLPTPHTNAGDASVWTIGSLSMETVQNNYTTIQIAGTNYTINSGVWNNVSIYFQLGDGSVPFTGYINGVQITGSHTLSNTTIASSLDWGGSNSSNRIYHVKNLIFQGRTAAEGDFERKNFKNAVVRTCFATSTVQSGFSKIGSLSQDQTISGGWQESIYTNSETSVTSLFAMQSVAPTSNVWGIQKCTHYNSTSSITGMISGADTPNLDYDMSPTSNMNTGEPTNRFKHYPINPSTNKLWTTDQLSNLHIGFKT